MSLLPFDTAVQNSQIPKNCVFLVDTCFLIESFYKTQSVEKSFRDKLLKANNSLVYNFSVKSELLHVLRANLAIDFLLKHSDTYSKEFQGFMKVKKYEMEVAPHKFLKSLNDSGYGSFFLKAMGRSGKRLKDEFEAVTFGVLYVGGEFKNSETKKTNHTPDFENVFNLMTEYALDSSDAMIINFGISKKSIDGLITTDKDFRYCKEDNFKIYTLAKYISIPVDKQWSSN